ncbi:4160_t:CDS:2 [Ambispora gerdemannii]|uniref:cystathionine gamma-synthase n=1 Tax=Ambispora gerdemannii TaxID=144530 RepID=A0A9N9FTC3_9GLOM|nr:4160_t:CDS:2 [Ambispora gerdemannii]
MPSTQLFTINELGCSIPANTPHAVSVTLPTWQDNVDYEEGRERVLSKMVNGYPRFFIHNLIKKLMSHCEQKFAKSMESCLLFPSRKAAQRCRDFLRKYYTPLDALSLSASTSISKASSTIARLAEITVLAPTAEHVESSLPNAVTLYVVIFPKDAFPVAKLYWQHTGDGISSRQAEYVLRLLQAKQAEEQTQEKLMNRKISPRKRYSNSRSPVTMASLTNTNNDINNINNNITNNIDNSITDNNNNINSSNIDINYNKKELTELLFEVDSYVEERYGRNLSVEFAEKAKIILKRRIAGVLGVESNEEDLQSVASKSIEGISEREVTELTEDDVYLFPSGMSSIFIAHQIILAAFPPKKSVCFGFVYADTLKVLEKFGPGCHFFGHGSSTDIDALENLLASGERILCLLCEFPSNPLLKSPDLKRLRALADKYDFLIIVDETIGNFVNVSVLAWADLIVSSLTKIFSGDSNVMGGGLMLNPQRRHYLKLKETLKVEYEDLFWAEDAIFLERNSRTFRERILKINENAEILCDLLNNNSKVKKVYYPKFVSSEIYVQYMRRNGGYGGLFSITFHSELASAQFFDALPIAKGPSLGTNFTLACPYTILAHYTELDWAAGFGVEKGLVRVSVGLEDKEILLAAFQTSLDAITDN